MLAGSPDPSGGADPSGGVADVMAGAKAISSADAQGLLNAVLEGEENCAATSGASGVISGNFSRKRRYSGLRND